MKKIVVIILMLSLTSNIVSCAYLSDSRQRMGAGGIGGFIAGAVISGNGMGAILGGILGTAFGVLIGEFYDEKWGSREEALMKYKLEKDEEKLIVEESSVIRQNICRGTKASIHFRYTVLAPICIEKIKINETIILLRGKNKLIKLAEREIFREQGTHRIECKFIIPEDLPEGKYTVITLISSTKQKETAISNIRVL